MELGVKLVKLEAFLDYGLNILGDEKVIKRRHMMKRLLTLALLAALAVSVSAADVYWVGGAFGGDGAAWEDTANWSADLATQYGAVPGTTDNVRVYGVNWISGWPTLSSTQNVGGLYLGLNNAGDASVVPSFLDIAATGSLSTNGTDGWNDGIQIGWYSDATITSAGTVNTLDPGFDGWTELGKGDAGNGFGNATINLVGGTWTTANIAFNASSTNHIQLDAGTMTTWGFTNLHVANQTIDITDGTLLFHTTDANWFPWIKTCGLTGYGSADNLVGTHDGNTWTVTAVPEPATLAILGFGALVLRRRRK